MNVAWLVVCVAPTFAQQLLDRVVARVEGVAITQTDVRAAVGLGLLDLPAGGGSDADAVQGMIERQLALGEVARFPPPEPDAAAVDAEAAALKKRAGTGLTGLMRATGIDDGRIRQFARDSLRIRAYMNQRFGATTQVTDEEVRDYYRANQQEFTRNGRLLPFEEAEAAARAGAAAERRRDTVAQWMSDLRARAEITEPARQQ